MGIPATLSSVPAQTPYIQYVATSGQTVFPYPFEITQDSDLVAVANGTTLATDSGYTLSGVGNATGGNLTFTSGRTVGDIITLYRDIPIERLTQFAQNGGFSSTAFNTEFNNVYLLLQQLQQNLDQCLQIPNTNNPAPTVSLTPGAYANKYLAFDGNGNPKAALPLTVATPAAGAILIGQTAAESANSIVPTNQTYAVGNVLRYGADPSGVSDSTTAITNAAKVSSVVYLPAGTYLCKPSTFTSLTGVSFIGDGIGATIVELSSAGICWTFSGCNFCSILGITFQPNGTLPASSAIKLISATGNTTIQQCTIQNFTAAGVIHTGTSGAPLSGNKLYDCYLLGNATTGSEGQLDMTYSNDFFIEKNQFGVTSQSSPWPNFGVQRANCSNGLFADNYVWQCTVGMSDSNCLYDRVIRNRFEQSQQNGYTASGNAECIFSLNWVNANGLKTANTYDSVSFSGGSTLTVTDNQIYDWTGSNNHRYSISITGSAATLTLKGNKCSGYGTEPYNFDSSEDFEVVDFDAAVLFSSGATLAANTTSYMGANVLSATESVAELPAPKRGVVARLTGFSTGTPTGSDTYTYTLMVNGTATSLTCTTNAGLYSSAGVLDSELISAGASLAVKVTSSTTAPACYHRAVVELASY